MKNPKPEEMGLVFVTIDIDEVRGVEKGVLKRATEVGNAL